MPFKHNMKQTEIYKLPQGLITISHCDKQLSIGLLELNPGQALSRHNRPVDEELVQISGSCTMKMFRGEDLVKRVVLKERERLVILANQDHIHSNPTEERSITLWKFEGNVVDIIESIRQSYRLY